MFEDSIGVDVREDGEFGVGIFKTNASVKSDVVADVSNPLPFEDNYADYIIAKHVVEHLIDFFTALKEWYRILKPGGKIIISLPDPRRCEAITCDPTHVHVFDDKTILNFLELAGFKPEKPVFELVGSFSFIVKAVKEEK